jgi:two-component system response regulator GlrR
VASDDTLLQRSTLKHTNLSPGPISVRRFKLRVHGDDANELVCESTADRCAVGSDPANELVIDDRTVSRFHCEIRVDEEGARVTDLGSRNGTIVDGVRVQEGYLRDGSLINLGRAVVQFQYGAESNRLPLSERQSFGNMTGRSAAMRSTFAILERVATSDATILLEGETGTGKSIAAEAVHEASPRREHPFVIVDCGAIPANLLESELFGHEKGSFTGADTRRRGAFEEASGGTIFLDEIGELPLELQPKLLRVLESKAIRRIGTNTQQPVDVRVLAATNRDLRAEVNAGRFRPDLYFRLAVVKVRLPSLRQRPEDLPVLAEGILRRLGAKDDQLRELLTPSFVALLQRNAWAGNVRELRNYLERCLVFMEPQPTGEWHEEAPAAGATAVDSSIPYADARQLAVQRFEKAYVEDLLARHGGKVSVAAEAAGIARVYLYRLMSKHGVR